MLNKKQADSEARTSDVSILERLKAELGLEEPNEGIEEVLSAIRALREKADRNFTEKPVAWAPRHNRTGTFLPEMTVAEEVDGVSLAKGWEYAPLFGVLHQNNKK
jgi:hypothetical protein